jgi:hypothetical protein
VKLIPTSKKTADTPAPQRRAEVGPVPSAPAGLVAFIGTGPGDEGLLTLRAAELLAKADLVVGRPELTGPLAHRLRERAAVADAADSGTDQGAHQGGERGPAGGQPVRR